MGESVRDVLFLIVLFAANVIQAITGFAGTVLAMPFSMLLLGTNTAKVVLNITTLLACLWLGVQHRAHIRWRILSEMVGLMAIGMAVGVASLCCAAVGPIAEGLWCVHHCDCTEESDMAVAWRAAVLVAGHHCAVGRCDTWHVHLRWRSAGDLCGGAFEG